jgi:hypothetical protein
MIHLQFHQNTRRLWNRQQLSLFQIDRNPIYYYASMGRNMQRALPIGSPLNSRANANMHGGKYRPSDSR